MWNHRTHHKQPTIFLVVDDNQAALITWSNDTKERHPFALHTYTALPAEWFLHGVPWHMSPFTTYLKSYIQQHALKKPLLACACSGDMLYEKIITQTHALTQAAIPPDQQFAHYAWHATSMPTQAPSSYATTDATFSITDTSFSTVDSTTDSKLSITKPTLSITNSPLSTINKTLPITDSTLPASSQENNLTTTSYLISGMPHSDILRLRMCTDKSGCTLHRITTLRASMQELYDYCHVHGITPENSANAPSTPNTTTADIHRHTSKSSDTLLSSLCTPLPESYNRRLVLAALGLSLFERKNA